MNGIVAIQPASANYPERLRAVLRRAQPLYAIGNLDLLALPAVGVCGSRNASREGLAWAYAFGERAAEDGRVLVSGYAKGVDRQAHAGAMAARGSTIAVLAEGIARFRMVAELQELATEENFLALSMFEPPAPWQAWRAMERNWLIVGQSEELYAVEPGERGGTADAVEKCRRLGKAVHIEGAVFPHSAPQPTLL